MKAGPVPLSIQANFPSSVEQKSQKKQEEKLNKKPSKMKGLGGSEEETEGAKKKQVDEKSESSRSAIECGRLGLPTKDTALSGR